MRLRLPIVPANKDNWSFARANPCSGEVEMKTVVWLSAFAIAAEVTCWSGCASADELGLKFATLDGPQAWINVRVHHPWVEKINEAANGLFRIQIFDGSVLANQGNIYDRVTNNVVQIGFGLPALAGKFPQMQVTSLPFLTDAASAETKSVALWRLYKTGLLDKEFDQIIPLKLVVFPPDGLHFHYEPATLDSLRGLKMLVSGKVSSQLVELLGGAPISFHVDEYYESLDRGLADGAVVGWTGFDPFKLADVTHYHLEESFGGSTGYVFMARTEWNGLPENVRRILAANSGEAESRAFGRFLDEVVAENKEKTIKMPGHTLLHLSAEQEKSWRDRTAAMARDWAKSTPDGKEILSTYTAMIAQVQASKQSGP
jgi:TRAP-type transport system periplasmic protein